MPTGSVALHRSSPGSGSGCTVWVPAQPGADCPSVLNAFRLPFLTLSFLKYPFPWWAPDWTEWSSPSPLRIPGLDKTLTSVLTWGTCHRVCFLSVRLWALEGGGCVCLGFVSLDAEQCAWASWHPRAWACWNDSRESCPGKAKASPPGRTPHHVQQDVHLQPQEVVLFFQLLVPSPQTLSLPPVHTSTNPRLWQKGTTSGH